MSKQDAIQKIFDIVNDTKNQKISKEYLKEIILEKSEEYKIIRIFKNNKQRIIHAPKAKLKYTLSQIHEWLNNIYTPTNIVNGYVNGKNIVSNAQPHTNKKYILKIDLKDFFPNISKNQIISFLQKNPFLLNYEEANIIAELVCVNNTLVQGFPTSAIISNIVCQDLDKDLITFCEKNNIICTRYADDIAFSLDIVFEKNIITEIENIIISHNFKINYKKKKILPYYQRQRITGIIVNEKVNISRKFIKEIRAILYNWENKGYLATEKSYCLKYKTKNFIKSIWSKIAFLGQVRGKNDFYYIDFSQKFKELSKTDSPSSLNNFALLEGVKKALTIIIENSHINIENNSIGYVYNQKELFNSNVGISNNNDLINAIFQIFDNGNFFLIHNITTSPIFINLFKNNNIRNKLRFHILQAMTYVFVGKVFENTTLNLPDIIVTKIKNLIGYNPLFTNKQLIREGFQALQLKIYGVFDRALNSDYKTFQNISDISEDVLSYITENNKGFYSSLMAMHNFINHSELPIDYSIKDTTSIKDRFSTMMAIKINPNNYEVFVKKYANNQFGVIIEENGKEKSLGQLYDTSNWLAVNEEKADYAFNESNPEYDNEENNNIRNVLTSLYGKDALQKYKELINKAKAKYEPFKTKFEDENFKLGDKLKVTITNDSKRKGNVVDIKDPKNRLSKAQIRDEMISRTDEKYFNISDKYFIDLRPLVPVVPVNSNDNKSDLLEKAINGLEPKEIQILYEVLFDKNYKSLRSSNKSKTLKENEKDKLEKKNDEEKELMDNFNGILEKIGYKINPSYNKTYIRYSYDNSKKVDSNFDNEGVGKVMGDYLSFTPNEMFEILDNQSNTLLAKIGNTTTLANQKESIRNGLNLLHKMFMSKYEFDIFYRENLLNSNEMKKIKENGKTSFFEIELERIYNIEANQVFSQFIVDKLKKESKLTKTDLTKTDLYYSNDINFVYDMLREAVNEFETELKKEGITNPKKLKRELNFKFRQYNTFIKSGVFYFNIDKSNMVKLKFNPIKAIDYLKQQFNPNSTDLESSSLRKKKDGTYDRVEIKLDKQDIILKSIENIKNKRIDFNFIVEDISKKDDLNRKGAIINRLSINSELSKGKGEKNLDSIIYNMLDKHLRFGGYPMPPALAFKLEDNVVATKQEVEKKKQEKTTTQTNTANIVDNTQVNNNTNEKKLFDLRGKLVEYAMMKKGMKDRGGLSDNEIEIKEKKIQEEIDSILNPAKTNVVNSTQQTPKNIVISNNVIENNDMFVIENFVNDVLNGNITDIENELNNRLISIGLNRKEIIDLFNDAFKTLNKAKEKFDLVKFEEFKNKKIDNLKKSIDLLIDENLNINNKEVKNKICIK